MASIEPKILIPYSEYQRLQTIAAKYEKLLDEHQRSKFNIVPPIVISAFTIDISN